jgi:hypothetical protein
VFIEIDVSGLFKYDLEVSWLRLVEIGSDSELQSTEIMKAEFEAI